MKGLMRIGCVVWLLVMAGSGMPLWAMGLENTEKVSKEETARQRKAGEAYAKVRQSEQAEKALAARREAYERRLKEQVASTSKSQSTSSAISNTARADEKKTAMSTETQKSQPVEESATITLRADDGATALVDLNWLLQLQPIASTFDEQHKTEVKDYKGEVKLCDYSQGDDKVERVAGCPVCDAVVQAWFDDVKTKAQLDVIVSALQAAYEQRMRMTPRDMAYYLVLKLAAEKFDADTLKNLWVIASPKLCFYPLATAAALQLVVAEMFQVRKAGGAAATEKDAAVAEKEAREKFIEEHNFPKPLVEQIAFEQAYAAGKAPALSASILQAYSFLPMQVAATVDAVWAAVEKHPRLAVLMEQLPPGKATIGLRTKMAEQKVEEKGFNRAVLETIPEGHFKYLLRKAYFQKNNQPIDDFPIKRVIEKLVPKAQSPTHQGGDVNLSYLGLTDVSWLNDELYLLNEKQAPKRLWLNNNKLAALPENFLQGCIQLQFLHLSYNELVALPGNFLQGCIQLQRLFLYDNKLAALPENFLQGCTRLEKLSLNRNFLVALPANFLQSCTQLRELFLLGNQLAALPDNFLQGCTELEELELCRNGLAALPANFLQGCIQLQRLDLEQNPWTTQRPDALVKMLKDRGVSVKYP